MADDSAEKPVEAQSEEKPTGSLQITVPAGKDKFRVLTKDIKSGKFQKQPKRYASTLENVKQTREFLNSKLEVDANGKLTKSSKSRYHQELEVIHEHIMNSRGTTDAKTMMAAGSNFKILSDRAFGPPRDQDIEAFQAGVSIVLVRAPQLPDSGELQPREQLKPNFSDAPFIEGEIVEEKK